MDFCSQLMNFERKLSPALSDLWPLLFGTFFDNNWTIQKTSTISNTNRFHHTPPRKHWRAHTSCFFVNFVNSQSRNYVQSDFVWSRTIDNANRGTYIWLSRLSLLFLWYGNKWKTLKLPDLIQLFLMKSLSSAWRALKHAPASPTWEKPHTAFVLCRRSDGKRTERGRKK